MRRSWQLLARPGFAGLVLAQLLARLPIGMWPIGILLHVQQRTGSYALAGAVVALMTAGRALGTPAASRLVGRWGSRVVLAVTAVGSAAAAVLLAALDLASPPWWLAILGYGVPAAVSGLLTPPVQPVVRSAYPGVVGGRDLEYAFSLDASSQEVIFVVGPVIAFGLAAGAGASWTIVAGAAGMLAGTAWLLASAGLPGARPVGERGRAGRVLLLPAVLAGTVVGLLLVAANSAVEAAVTAAFSSRAATAGGLLALYSVTSLVGGLLFSRLTAGRLSRAGWMALVAAGLALAPLRPDAWWLGLCLAVAGLGVAPVFAAVAHAVSSAATPGQAAEAFGWVDAGAIVGASCGFFLAGLVIEPAGAPGALWLAAGLALAGSALALVTAARPSRP